MTAGPNEPFLATPDLDEILERAKIHRSVKARGRVIVIEAMREAAEKRLAGVTENKRRRYYGHAAELVAACAAIDPTAETQAWVTAIRAQYRRYPALRSEFDDRLGRA